MKINPLYIVLCVNLVIWVGIFSYLLKLENTLKRIEKQ